MSTPWRALPGVAVLVVVAWTGFAPMHRKTATKPTGANAAVVAQAAAEFASDHIMSAANYTRLRNLADSTRSTHSISAADLAFATQQMSAPSSEPSLIHARVATTFCSVTSYQPGQKPIMFSDFAPVLSRSDPLDKLSALLVVEHLQDPRAAAAVVPLLNDPNAKVRAHAASYLKEVGYHLGTARA